MGNGLSPASLKNPPQDASSATLSNPIADAVGRAMANPLQHAIAAAMHNPMQEALDAIERYAAPMREAQRAADQMLAACNQAGYGPRGLYETMLRMEEQQRLMDQINITHRYSLWPMPYR